nr:hypothetical protein [Tanacetum cinerariifolium]
VRDDVLFSTIKVVSRHQTTQQYGTILSIELTNDEIRNSKAYKEYYACATGEAAPKLKASARKKKGDSTSSTTPPTPTPTTTVVSAPRLSATAKDKRRTSLSNMVPIQMKELVLDQGFRMYHLMTRRKNFHGTLLMMNMTPEGSEEESNDEEDQELRLSEDARIQEEEEADELYFDVNINQGRGLQVTQNVEDSHVTLTPV